MRSPPPQSLGDHFDFAEAFNELGRQVFPGECTGEEVNLAGTGSVLCPEEAQELRSDAEGARTLLRESGGRYNDEDIRAIFEENESTGDFDHALMDDDPRDAFSWPKLVKRLYFVISYFDGKPAPDSPEYKELDGAYIRGTEVLGTMLGLLLEGEVQASLKGEHGRAVIEPGLWGARTLNIDVASSAVRLPDAHQWMGGITIPRARAEAAFRKIVQERSQQSRRDARSACREALTKMMREAPKAPRRKRDVRREFPLVSDREFNRIWSEVIDTTGASAWGWPGRRPEQSESDHEIVA
jgi:hypothetical protein